MYWGSVAHATTEYRHVTRRVQRTSVSVCAFELGHQPVRYRVASFRDVVQYTVDVSAETVQGGRAGLYPVHAREHNVPRRERTFVFRFKTYLKVWFLYKGIRK